MKGMIYGSGEGWEILSRCKKVFADVTFFFLKYPPVLHMSTLNKHTSFKDGIKVEWFNVLVHYYLKIKFIHLYICVTINLINLLIFYLINRQKDTIFIFFLKCRFIKIYGYGIVENMSNKKRNFFFPYL